MPDPMEPFRAELQSSMWRMLIVVGALYVLAPTIWMVLVPEARRNVARLARNITIGFLMLVAVSAGVASIIVGLRNPYIWPLIRSIAAPVLIMLTVSILMAVITHLWAGKSPGNES